MSGTTRYLLVAVGGALGSMLRYWAAMYAGATWTTTFLVNITGAFFIGLLAGSPIGADARARLLLASGFLGGFTTFSTWQLEALLSARQGNTLAVAANLAGSLAIGFLAVLLGYYLGGRVR